MSEPVCRICHEEDDTAEDPLIQPCDCTDLIHRKCLDGWRVVSPHPDGFDACEICRARFTIDYLVMEATTRRRQCLAYTMAGCNVLVILLIAAGVALGIGQVVDVMRGRETHILAPGFPAPYLDSEWGRVLIYGGIGFCAILGMIGCFVWACCGWNQERHIRRAMRMSDSSACYMLYCGPCSFGDKFICGGCGGCGGCGDPCGGCGGCVDCGGGDCGGGGGDCGGEGAAILCVLLLIVLAILVVAGIIFGAMLIGVVVVSTARRYTMLADRKERVAMERVVDRRKGEPSLVIAAS